jgi:hypothetical protein
MKVSVHKLARRNLDVEMRPFRQAGMDRHPTQAVLQAVRKALRIPPPRRTRDVGRMARRKRAELLNLGAFELSRWRDGRCGVDFPRTLLAV